MYGGYFEKKKGEICVYATPPHCLWSKVIKIVEKRIEDKPMPAIVINSFKKSIYTRGHKVRIKI